MCEALAIACIALAQDDYAEGALGGKVPAARTFATAPAADPAPEPIVADPLPKKLKTLRRAFRFLRSHPIAQALEAAWNQGVARFSRPGGEKPRTGFWPAAFLPPVGTSFVLSDGLSVLQLYSFSSPIPFAVLDFVGGELFVSKDSAQGEDIGLVGGLPKSLKAALCPGQDRATTVIWLCATIMFSTVPEVRVYMRAESLAQIAAGGDAAQFPPFSIFVNYLQRVAPTAQAVLRDITPSKRGLSTVVIKALELARQQITWWGRPNTTAAPLFIRVVA